MRSEIFGTQIAWKENYEYGYFINLPVLAVENRSMWLFLWLLADPLIFQVCYPLIDKLMDGVDGSSVNSVTSTSHLVRNRNVNARDSGELHFSANLIGLSETLLCYESNDLLVSYCSYFNLFPHFSYKFYAFCFVPVFCFFSSRLAWMHMLNAWTLSLLASWYRGVNLLLLLHGKICILWNVSF